MADDHENTEWRQGHLLSDADAAKLFPKIFTAGKVKAIIVSHDCDLTRPPDSEPVVEVIFGNVIEELDGNFTSAKNARTLHLSISGGTNPIRLEMEAPRKSSFPKELLLSIKPDQETGLMEDERNTFQVWLAARYRRSAFPNSFNDRLKAKRIDEKLAKKLKPHGDSLIGLYFDIDDVEHEVDAGCHELEIYVLYKEDGNDETFESKKALVTEIKTIFKAAFFDVGQSKWMGIELVGCTEVSDHAMSIALIRRLKRWNADYLSLRANPQQLVLA